MSLGRGSFLSRDATELVPISGDVIRQKSTFHVQRPRAGEVSECRFKISLAIIGLVCPEARVKFKACLPN
jgi:hypothetical protein